MAQQKDSTQQTSAAMPDAFDYTHDQLSRRPDTIKVGVSTIRVSSALPLGLGGVTTYLVQTFRTAEEGDTIFLEGYVGKRLVRLALPPRVADAIARQREALTAKARSQASLKVAAERKARGEVPAFARNEDLSHGP